MQPYLHFFQRGAISFFANWPVGKNGTAISTVEIQVPNDERWVILYGTVRQTNVGTPGHNYVYIQISDMKAIPVFDKASPTTAVDYSFPGNLTDPGNANTPFLIAPENSKIMIAASGAGGDTVNLLYTLVVWRFRRERFW